MFCKRQKNIKYKSGVKLQSISKYVNYKKNSVLIIVIANYRLAKMLPTTTTIFISFLIGETACCRDYNK